MSVLVVIPAYNEECSIAQVAYSVAAAGYDYVVVNDGSTDGTARECREHSLDCIGFDVNRGIAAAFRAGVNYALERGYDCVVQFDGDGQHRPEYISSLVDKVSDGYDIVIGSRFVHNKKPVRLRTLGSNMLSSMIESTAGVTIADPTSGMRAFGPRALAEFQNGRNLGPEPNSIAYLVREKGLRVVEVPVEMNERISGKSYLTPRQSIIYMARMTASISVLNLKRR